MITDFADGQDRIELAATLWAQGPPDVDALLATAQVTSAGVVLNLGTGAALDIRGIFDASLLVDDIQFI